MNKYQQYFLMACLALMAAWLMFGCAEHTQPLGPIVAPPDPVTAPGQSLAHSVSVLITLATWVNVISWFALAVGIGATIYGVFSADRPVENLGIMVASSSAALAVESLTSIIVLPFSPWLILGLGVLALAGVGYEVYVRFFKKTPAIVTSIAAPVVEPPK